MSNACAIAQDGAKAKAHEPEINGFTESMAVRRLLRAARGAQNRMREWIDLGNAAK